jgi:hypothetical protein
MSEHGSVTVEIEPPYSTMIHDLREEHGEAIDAHLQAVLKDAVHESYKELESQ